MDYRDTTVIIPTLNEAENIRELLKLVIGGYRGAKVIVADDGSSDRTQELARKAGAIVLDRGREPVHGITTSVIDAIRHCKTRFFVVIDGDLQHPPEKIWQIVKRLREGNGIVIGTRVKVAGKWSVQRRAMSVIATNLARLRLMKPIKDPMSGFFGMRTEFARNILRLSEPRFEKEGYKALFDILKYCGGCRIAEVDYNFGDRKRGKSKIRIKHAIAMLRALLK